MECPVDCKMVVEQLGSQEYRMRYDEKRNTFIQTRQKYLGFVRHFQGIYGWIVGYGTPPAKHLDVLVPTGRRYSLGEVVPIRIVGCFKRNDNDNKFVGVGSDRQETTLNELPAFELKMLKAMYPDIRDGEAWLERRDAVALITEHGE